MNVEKINALLDSEAFQSEVKDVTTAEELQKLFSKYGVELTEEEVSDFCVQVAAHADENQSGELSENDLESVAGGFISGTAFLAWSVCYSVVVIGRAISYAKSKKKK